MLFQKLFQNVMHERTACGRVELCRFSRFRPDFMLTEITKRTLFIILKPGSGKPDSASDKPFGRLFIFKRKRFAACCPSDCLYFSFVFRLIGKIQPERFGFGAFLVPSFGHQLKRGVFAFKQCVNRFKGSADPVGRRKKLPDRCHDLRFCKLFSVFSDKAEAQIQFLFRRSQTDISHQSFILRRSASRVVNVGQNRFDFHLFRLAENAVRRLYRRKQSAVKTDDKGHL